MFTGIVQGKAKVLQIDGNDQLKTFTFVFPSNHLNSLQQGASIAINGTCLTVTRFDLDQNTACFDVMNETLTITNLGCLSEHDEVNFERAAKIGDEIGGHLMSGHIHTCVTVKRIIRTKDNCSIYFLSPQPYQPYLLEKGFIGLNGCSLTVGEVNDDVFCVHLIPETLSITTFGQLKENNRVNLEIDHQTQCIVDTVKRVLIQRKF